MSTQNIAVETMVLAGLQNLYADESALENMFDTVQLSPAVAGGPNALLLRLIALDLRASRIDRLLDAMD